MTIKTIPDYITAHQNEGLTKIEIKCDSDDIDDMYVIQTKETYTFMSEEEANEKIDAVRSMQNFIGVDKKYKAGKVNKAGEVVKPETWVVTAKLAQ